MNRKCRLMIGAAVLLCIASAGCSNDPEYVEDTGKLRVNIITQAVEELPPDSQSIDIHEFEIHGTGPEGSEHTGVRFQESEINIVDLEPGDWEFHIIGFDDMDHRVAEDAEVITVSAGTASLWDAFLTPICGFGEMSLEIILPASFEDELHIETCLLEPFCDNDPIELVPEDGIAEKDSIPSGYYRLFVSIGGNDHTVWSNIYSVRILADQKMEFTLEIPEEDMNTGGSLDVQVDSNLFNPLELTISPASREIETDEFLPVSAELSSQKDEDLEYHYSWYENGEHKEILESDSCVLTFQYEGTYQITVLVFAENPETQQILQAGYDTFSLKVISPQE